MTNQKTNLEIEELIKTISLKNKTYILDMNNQTVNTLIKYISLENTNTNNSILIFLLNQSKELFIQDLLDAQAGIDTNKSNLQDYDFEKLAGAMNQFANSQVYISNKYYDIEGICKSITDFERENNEKPNFVVIKGLKTISNNQNSAEIIDKLKIFAQNNVISFIIIK